MLTRTGWILLSGLGMTGCVSLEMPDHLVSDTANVAKDAYHAIVGDDDKAAQQQTTSEHATAPAADGTVADGGMLATEPAAAAQPEKRMPATASTPASTPKGEYEYVFVGDEGMSLKEAKATCFKNAAVLARRAAGTASVQPRLVSEKVELDSETIVVTCRVAQE